METKIFINNVPKYALNTKNPFWVVKVVDNEIWFYGAYKTEESAYAAMIEIDKTHDNTFIVVN